MSRRGNPYDNAVMEAWNSTFEEPRHLARAALERVAVDLRGWRRVDGGLSHEERLVRADHAALERTVDLTLAAATVGGIQ